MPGYDLRLMDRDGNVLSGGGTGILEVRGDSSAPFYWHQHARSQQTMRGDWVVTGDLYRVDRDGFYWYEGRADDMIKVGGEWVSPIEIENALIAHPSVQEVAVVGVSVDGTTRIRAVIVLAPEHRESDTLTRALQEWCKERLQRYQFPHSVASRRTNCQKPRPARSSGFSFAKGDCRRDLGDNELDDVVQGFRCAVQDIFA